MPTYRMTPARKAALRKAQQASARKRRRGGAKSSRRRKNMRRAAVAGGVAVGVAGAVYAANKNKARIKRNIRKKAENNRTIRAEVTKKLMEEARSKKKPARNGMKMGKKYRMGRPDVRKKRKAARGG